MPGQGQGLDKTQLILKLKQMRDKLKNITNKDEIDDIFYEELADAIEEYIKSGKVVTAGTAAAQTGTIT